MIALSPEAEAQLDALIAHDEALGRVEASINLLNALERAKARISERPEAGLHAPRPYPSLAKAGRRRIIEGACWISYSATAPPVISGVFYAMTAHTMIRRRADWSRLGRTECAGIIPDLAFPARCAPSDR